MTGTLTLAGERPTPERPLIIGPQLVLALNCADPTSRPVRFSLEDVDTVLFGRGPRRLRTRADRTLRIEVPDGFLSSSHLRFTKNAKKWFVEDAGSKNGSSLQGASLLERTQLSEGAIISAGQVLLLFVEDGKSIAGELDQDLTGISAQSPTATLHADLALAFEALLGVAKSSLPVLLHGETGTGKEVLAQAVHQHSGRKGKLVAINCGALPPTLITSELFGAKKGAFSGATENRRGLVRAADQGTLFLDEIAELPADAQAVLLRVLQEGEVLPVGSDAPIRVNVRILAASHRNLLSAVEDGRFREDLYARLAGYVFTLPALRERPADIGLLLGFLLERNHPTGTAFTPEAGRLLLAYDWPRNIRELHNALAAASAVAGGLKIDVEHLPESLRLGPSPTTLTAADTEAALRESLARHSGNVSATARDLGTSRSQVRRLAEKFGLDLSSFRD